MYIEKVINKLNEFNQLSPDAAFKLFANSVEVDSKLAHESAFMCGKLGDKYVISVVGLLNGLVDDGVLAAIIDFSKGKVIEFIHYDKSEDAE